MNTQIHSMDGRHSFIMSNKVVHIVTTGLSWVTSFGETGFVVRESTVF
jgi:hypothetical protein